MLNILDYVLDSKGDILHAYVTVLRNNGITSTLKEVEGNLEFLENFEEHEEKLRKTIDALKNALSHTSRLWDMNLNVLRKAP